MGVMNQPRPTLSDLGPDEWGRINRDQAEDAARAARERTVEERIEAGLALSAIAHDIREAVRQARGDERST